MSHGKWRNTEGGSGGRGHSNIEHWDTTDRVKMNTRRSRRHQDRQVIEDELMEFEEQYSELSPAEMNAISDADIAE